MKRPLFFFQLISLLYCSLVFTDTPEEMSERPKIAKEYYKLAKLFHKTGNHKKAISYYQQSLEIEPNDFNTLFKLANIHFDLHNLDDAIELYNKSITIKPAYYQPHYNLGICYRQKNNFDLAIKEFKKTIELCPNHAKAYFNLGMMLEKQNKHELAIESYKNAIKIDSKLYEAHYHLGNIYKHLERLEDAIEPYRIALSLQPNNTTIILELANTLNMLDQTNEALELYIKALEINPHLNSALYNFGFTLKKLGRMHEAIEIYNKVLQRNPDYPLAHFSLSAAYLAIGDFERGWEEYEWRWKAYNESPKKFNKPLWEGQDLSGKTILIYSEQGLGDTLQFVRYAQLIQEQGAIVIFQTQAPLATLLARCPYLDAVLTNQDQLPEFDYQVPLMSLPRIFKTRLETIPTNIPYIFADYRLTYEWRKELAKDTNFKIGICWQGNAHYRTQSLRRAVAAKSIALEKLAPLSQIPGISLYSLQKVDGAEQIQKLHPLNKIYEFGPSFDQTNGRFMDTVAVIKNLDLIISVDTSIGHLAGALGAPVWLLLPYPADWRWLRNRTDTPWYPSMRLFQQPKAGDWNSVINSIRNELLQLINHHKNPLLCDQGISQAIPDILLTSLDLN